MKQNFIADVNEFADEVHRNSDVWNSIITRNQFSYVKIVRGTSYEE